MIKTNNSKIRFIWLSVLVLFVCVAATTVVFTNRVNAYLLDDEGAISLISETQSPQSSDNLSDTEDTAAQTVTSEVVSATDSPETKAPSVANPKPGFEASDDSTVWATDTKVDIFRISYVNGEQLVTVQGENGEKVIAPGTENSYTFKLKNTGNVPVDYKVEVNAYFTPADIEIPIVARLNRYDGKWIVGGREEYEKIPSLDSAWDEASLGAGKYTYYTLDWMWPFESGNDEFDTLLGNLAVDSDLVFTVEIITTATANDDPTVNSGITPPQTGDNTNLTFWIVLSAASFAIMMILVAYQLTDERRKRAKAGQN